MSCMKSQGVFLPFVILFYLNGFLCTLTQHITCLASNKQSQTLCFEKKWHFQPHSLLLFWFIFLTYFNGNFIQKSTLFQPNLILYKWWQLVCPFLADSQQMTVFLWVFFSIYQTDTQLWWEKANIYHTGKDPLTLPEPQNNHKHLSPSLRSSFSPIPLQLWSNFQTAWMHNRRN